MTVVRVGHLIFTRQLSNLHLLSRSEYILLLYNVNGILLVRLLTRVHRARLIPATIILLQESIQTPLLHLLFLNRAILKASTDGICLICRRLALRSWQLRRVLEARAESHETACT